MFEEKNKRSGVVRTLLISVISSLAVSTLVFFAAQRYVSLDEPGNGIAQGNNGVQMQLTAKQNLQAGDLLPGKEKDELNRTIQTNVLDAVVPVAQAVAKKATSGVVGITVERATQNSLFDRNRETEVGFGSGVIVSSSGYILTNNHVAGGNSNRIIVSLADGRNVDGEVVWADPVLDLAAVKVNLSDLTPLVLGDATMLEVGETAIAIGNPLGMEFQRSVTSGIVSALNRTISIETDTGSNYMEDLIQTDASINPGNSGGPLLNSKGEVIGINTIKVSSAEGMGFAIPINITKPIMEKLVQTGSFTEPYMGLFAYDKSVIPYVDGDAKVQNGIYVAYIDSTGPAYRAGIREGCIIRQVDDVEINTMLQLRTHIYSKSPGDTVRITHLKHGSDRWTNTSLVLAKKTKDGLITR